ncbi:MAG: biopolymer transporter ExbD [Deltaproteobacteria bacterium]|nr:biopolymer transporter ExbD [Deltaproteobacteria bacterium]
MVRRRKHEDREVDLAALVDVLANMLFFLLATVTFLQLKTLNAAVPALTTGAVSTDKVVNVSVEIHPAGYSVKASGDAADKSIGAVNVDKTVARKSDNHLDTKALTAELWDIKKKTPETKNIMIFPEQGTPFEEIVQTMDAAREMPSILDAKKKVPLFTRPVLSELVTDDDKPREEP